MSKYKLLILYGGSTLILAATNVLAGTYTTTFPLLENRISETNHWINGKTVGLDWCNVATSAGLAFGTETGTINYDDSTALLTGTWGPTQTVTAIVHVGTRPGSGSFKEVELRLRSGLSAHSCTGYEVNFSTASGSAAYTQIVRWNGALGNFTLIDSRGGSQYQINDGDEVKAVIAGNTITSYIRGQKALQVTDSNYASGSPGIGFYLGGSGASDFGFTSFSATDGSNQPPVAPPLLMQPKRFGAGGFGFQFSGQMGQSYTMLGSTDLVHWAVVTNVVITVTPTNVVDGAAGNTVRKYYRLRSP